MPTWTEELQFTSAEEAGLQNDQKWGLIPQAGEEMSSFWQFWLSYGRQPHAVSHVLIPLPACPLTRFLVECMEQQQRGKQHSSERRPPSEKEHDEQAEQSAEEGEPGAVRG